jgi:hypothetical protein
MLTPVLQGIDVLICVSAFLTPISLLFTIMLEYITYRWSTCDCIFSTGTRSEACHRDGLLVLPEWVDLVHIILATTALVGLAWTYIGKNTRRAILSDRRMVALKAGGMKDVTSSIATTPKKQIAAYGDFKHGSPQSAEKEMSLRKLAEGIEE